ncbi:Inversin [Fusarium oxysporum f. sp. albedinis]|nr:Inversin [Fusarium oxysporum f. sp. albedinis]
MLPIPLLGTYQQYKADTNSVAAWPASTAKACGCPADLLTSNMKQTSQQKVAGRLKGKARKDAKKKKPAQSTAPKGRNHYIHSTLDQIEWCTIF